MKEKVGEIFSIAKDNAPVQETSHVFTESSDLFRSSLQSGTVLIIGAFHSYACHEKSF